MVNIMDIERYQFAGVIGKDKKSIPRTDFVNGLESTWILIVLLNLCPCGVFYLCLRILFGLLTLFFFRNSESRKENGERRTGSGDVASWI